MFHTYDPFIIREAAGGRVFFVNAEMPFELFMNCFNDRQPLFIFTHLYDGRIAIIPNVSAIPSWQNGSGVHSLLPSDCEYVTLQNATYPIFITAHPVHHIREWSKKFECRVIPFAQQSLSEFVMACCDTVPLPATASARVNQDETIALA